MHKQAVVGGLKVVVISVRVGMNQTVKICVDGMAPANNVVL